SEERLLGGAVARHELPLRLHEVEVAAPLLRPRPRLLVRQKMAQRAQKIGAELALFGRRVSERAALQEGAEELLRQILGGLDVVAAAADEEVDGFPISRDETIERVARAAARVADDGPGGGLEPDVVAADVGFVAHY